jgi:hypothetical protein
MKTTKILLIALVAGAVAATSAIARPSAAPSVSNALSVSYRGHHHHHHHHSNFVFGVGLGYPYYGYGYGYPYYGSYPYGYGYYSPRTPVYGEVAITDDATVAAVQRRLARAGYYHGSIDGVIGNGTRNAIRNFERSHGLVVDGRIDRRLLATMGLS